MRKLNPGWYPFCALLAIGAAACSSRIQAAYDRDTDFRTYTSWCWMQGCEFTFSGPEYLDKDRVRTGIQDAISAEMADRRLLKDDNNPDLLVDFHITVTDETSVLYHPDFDNDFLRPSEGVKREEIRYLKGTLIVDMADRSSGRMVWRSVAIGYYDTHPEITEENIRRGIHRALKGFPPKP